MKTINNSGYTEDEIAKMQVIGSLKNKWLERNVTVLDSGVPEEVVSVGVSFNLENRFICKERRADYKRCISVYPMTAVFE